MEGHNSGTSSNYRKAFTLIELLVVMSIISLLMAILIPVLGKVRQRARKLIDTNNQRQTTVGLNSFAADNNERYPESVATIGNKKHWNWGEPTTLTSFKKRSLHRSMSAYLSTYISNPKVLFCPNAPQKKYKYLQQIWEAGDDWDNPEESSKADPFYGTYCFYWNYVGYLEGRKAPFRGPANTFGRGQSKLLLSDYFGYDHWANPGVYRSSERFKGASASAGTWVFASYWVGQKSNDGPRPPLPEVELQAAYIDGHVETFTPSDAIPMKMSLAADGSVPYPEGLGGVFYLPKNALD